MFLTVEWLVPQTCTTAFQKSLSGNNHPAVSLFWWLTVWEHCRLFGEALKLRLCVSEFCLRVWSQTRDAVRLRGAACEVGLSWRFWLTHSEVPWFYRLLLFWLVGWSERTDTWATLSTSTSSFNKGVGKKALNNLLGKTRIKHITSLSKICQLGLFLFPQKLTGLLLSDLFAMSILFI